MTAHEKFLAVQAAAAALVERSPYFAGIEIFTERKGDLDQAIRLKLSKLGLCVVVMTPDFEITAQIRTRRIVKVRVVVECSEIVLTNSAASGTQKPALAAAWAAALAIDNQPNGTDPADDPHLPMTREFVLHASQPVHLVPDKTLLVYHATLHTEVSV